MKELKDVIAKIHPEIIGCRLSCIRCHNKEEDCKGIKSFQEYVDLNSKTYRSNEIVLNDYNCKECGCNTFDIDTFVKIELK